MGHGKKNHPLTFSLLPLALYTILWSLCETILSVRYELKHRCIILPLTHGQGERNYIMQVVCEATQNPSVPVQVAAFECLVRIMSLYYDKMGFYMERALFGVSFHLDLFFFSSNQITQYVNSLPC